MLRDGSPSAPQEPSPSDALLSVPRGADEVAGGEGLPWATLPPVVSTADDSDADLQRARAPGQRAGGPVRRAVRGAERAGDRAARSLARGPAPHVADPPLAPSQPCALGRTRWRCGGRSLGARRTGWDPVELVRVRPVPMRRRVVMLCDVSQSMQAQVPAYFHLMRALCLVVGGEAFAFGTAPDPAHAGAAAPFGGVGRRPRQRAGDRPVRRHADRGEPERAARLPPRQRRARGDRRDRLGRLGQRAPGPSSRRRWPGSAAVRTGWCG